MLQLNKYRVQIEAIYIATGTVIQLGVSKRKIFPTHRKKFKSVVHFYRNDSVKIDHVA